VVWRMLVMGKGGLDDVDGEDGVGDVDGRKEWCG